MSKKLYLALGVVLLVAFGAIGYWLPGPKNLPTGQTAMAEYRLSNLSCGSCVSNIQKTLAGVEGVDTIEVDLTSHRGTVTYDPGLINSLVIGDTITAAGYPAQLRAELTPAELAALQQEQNVLGQKYIARIGERMVARSDFQRFIQQRSGNVPLQQQQALKGSLWNDLLQRELLLESAAQNEIIVRDVEVDFRLEELIQRHAGFEQMIAQRYPDQQVFRDLLRDDLTIERNLDTHVFAGMTNPQLKQQRFQQWFSELQQSTEVVIFDPEIKALATGGSGCGGSCCG